MPKKITPAMVAEKLGYTAQAIRVAMQQQKMDLGTAYKPTGREYVYRIYPEKARAILGDKIMEEWGY